MNKRLAIIVMSFAITVPAVAEDAARTTIIPGVLKWCRGCCDNEGYSWIEVGGNSWFHHQGALHAPFVSIGLVVVGLVIVAMGYLKKPKTGLPQTDAPAAADRPVRTSRPERDV